MRKGASEERRRYWREIIERQPTSGLNITQFCAQAGVSQNSFYVWKRRLRLRVSRERKTRAKSSLLVPVQLIPDVPSPATRQPIEVAWPSGLVLRIPTPCDAPTLQEVFQLLAAMLSNPSPAC